MTTKREQKRIALDAISQRASSSPGESVKQSMEGLKLEREVISPTPFEKEIISSVSFEKETISTKPKSTRSTRSRTLIEEKPPRETINSVSFEKEIAKTRPKFQYEGAFDKDTFKDTNGNGKSKKKTRPASIKDFKLYRPFSDRRKSQIPEIDPKKEEGAKSPVITMLRDLSKGKKKRETASVWLV